MRRREKENAKKGCGQRRKMKIGILVLSIGNFGTKGFYNLQEIGLAKAMDALGNAVKVYKLVPQTEENRIHPIVGTRRASIQNLPSKKVGTNGLPKMKLLDKDLDALICFSDTQFALPKVYRWARKNGITFFPYIGVVKSHSNRKIKRVVADFLFRRNLAVYRKCRCLTKTPTVQAELEAAGVKHITVAPVGLDQSLLKTDYEDYAPEKLKRKYGYQAKDKVLLFIGRLTEEKQPVRMIELLSEIQRKNPAYRLLMVGSGEQKPAVEQKISALHLERDVQMLDRIPNRDIWELYRFADAFVNLNRQEIFGMSILEAMYYGCKVVAWRAPGPDLMIEHGKSGWLAQSNEEIVEIICNPTDVAQAAHQRVLDHFTWETTAKKILSIVGD